MGAVTSLVVAVCVYADESTRVVLTSSPDSTAASYINANYIRVRDYTLSPLSTVITHHGRQPVAAVAFHILPHQKENDFAGGGVI